MGVRQCAWCLRLMNSTGERVSVLPVPKIYEATHGICRVCTLRWLESVGKETGAGAVVERVDDGQYRVREEETHG